MFKIDGLNFAIYFKSRVFCKNSFYLRVRFRERFVNPQLLKQLAVYKIKEDNFEEWLEVLKHGQT